MFERESPFVRCRGLRGAGVLLLTCASQGALSDRPLCIDVDAVEQFPGMKEL